jgi:hypothetical protein
MKEPRDSKFWSQVDWIFATEVNCNWYGLKICNHSKKYINTLFLYRAFFDQDVEDHGFEHAVTGAQVVDPTLE